MRPYYLHTITEDAQGVPTSPTYAGQSTDIYEMMEKAEKLATRGFVVTLSDDRGRVIERFEAR